MAPLPRFAVLLLVVLSAVMLCSCGRDSARATGPLSQEAYVWQRAWNEPVHDAIRAHSGAFNSIVVLGAEVSWKKGQLNVVRAAIDFDSLRLAKCPVGIALRIGPFGGPFSSQDANAKRLAEFAHSLVQECVTNQLALCELQIDFDCASSKLRGYQLWIEAIRQTIGSTPLVITALTSWLDQRDFKYLVASVDSYILQVHSLDRPKAPDAEFSLCNPKVARRAVERAAQFGKAFRVALPTYGYTVAFNREKKFIGLSADGPELIWPEGTILRDVRSEPDAMAALVRDWSSNRPAALSGVIWYRLPVATDTLNWGWPTLAAAMAGRAPKESLRAETSFPRTGLVEVALVNDGEKAAAAFPVIQLEWQNARLVAGDGLGGFHLANSDAVTAQLTSKDSPELKPGESRKIGWLRLDQADASVQLRTF